MKSTQSNSVNMDIWILKDNQIPTCIGASTNTLTKIMNRYIKEIYWNKRLMDVSCQMKTQSTQTDLICTVNLQVHAFRNIL